MCYVTWYRISRGAWSPSCALRVMTSWMPPYSRPQTTSQEHPQPWQKKPHSWVRIPHPRRLGRLQIPSWPPIGTPEPEDTSRLADPQDAQEQIPPLSPVSGLPTQVSDLPPLEDAGPLISNPGEAQLEITSLASMEMIMVRNTLSDEFECCYQTQLISIMSLHLNPFEAWGQPGTDWELMD